jgi:two-component system cell cycle sensor histidine kinase/response regulator CckA
VRVGLRDLASAVVFVTIGFQAYRFAKNAELGAMRISAAALIVDGLQQLHYGMLFAVGVARGARVNYIDHLWLFDSFIHVVLGVGMVAALFEEQMRAQTRSLAVLRRAKESLDHAQKMEAIGRLASGVAHDFNNVLTAIMSYGDEIESGLPKSSRLALPARGIRDAATRAAGLVRQLLSFSKRKSSDEAIIAINSIVDRAVEMLRRTIGEHVVLRSSYADSLKNVRLERDRMIEVVVNLIVNARDAMPEGGSITVRTFSENVTASTTSAGEYSGECICVEVEDTGIGMTAEVRSRIFEPFFTTKEHGTGLGLSMVYGFVQRMQGSIDVKSRAGVGTTIKMSFPAVDLPATPECRDATVDLPSRSTDTGRRDVRVLLVEDEPEIREVIRRSLAKHGIAVTEASDGQEALKVFSGAPDSFDLLLSDVIMPTMGGIELARNCRAIRSELPILFVSGYAVDLEEFSGDACSTKFVQKPFQPVALAEIVMNLLAAKSPSREAAAGG